LYDMGESKLRRARRDDGGKAVIRLRQVAENNQPGAGGMGNDEEYSNSRDKRVNRFNESTSRERSALSAALPLEQVGSRPL